ncbi:mycothiol transferase [Streptomyces sp. NPDC001985]|uniref:mycothiol transferase n=1 Tax=Streptomyces sp. NPDC001985 TaxID=3154406 RepID=UPI003322DA37
MTGDGRVGPPRSGSGRGTLRAFLDCHRATLAMKCAGLTDEELPRRVERTAEPLDVTGYQRRWGEEVSLRMVVAHVLLEHGRHNGHAGLPREGIDGVVGA